MFNTFHFLRPEWLLALVPLALLGWVLFRRRSQSATEGWARHVDSHLLAALAITGTAAKRGPWVPVAGSLMVLLTVIGLAGPTWEERELPSFEGGAPVVAVLSLAQSMNADDLTPTRLKRSVHKLRDILERTAGDERGLVIYADTPFVAAPLTSDAQVIEQMLPELSTSLMPVLGNRLDLAIAEATAMLERSGAVGGKIILMADDAGNDPAASVAAAQAAARAGYSVSVLGAGTEGGATLQTADGRAIADREGQTFQTALAAQDLQAVASAGDGVFARITAGDADLERVFPDQTRTAAGDRQDFNADGWVDMGYWMLILPALLMPFAFRRGLVFGLGLTAFGLVQPQGAQAGTWDDLWATPDQQGQAAFEAGDFASATGDFVTPAWQGAAAYRAGAFAQAAEGFAGDDYNRGNALAKAGEFEQALAAYDAALEVNPEDADAQFNRDLVAELLKQQEQDQQQSGEEDQRQDQSSGGEGQQDQQSGGESQQDQQQSGGENQQSGESGQQESEASQGQSGAQEDEGSSSSASEETSQEGSQSNQAGEAAEQQESAAQDGAAQPETAEQTSEQAEESPEPSETGSQSEANAEAAEAQLEAEVRRSTMGKMLSDLLGEGDPQEMVEGSAPGAEPIDQAIEQQLRRVPDDPSGLLRARIRQHYARARQGS